MEITEEIVKFVEGFLVKLSANSYTTLLDLVARAREAGLVLPDVDIPTLGIQGIMVNMEQDRYDRLLVDINARRS